MKTYEIKYYDPVTKNKLTTSTIGSDADDVLKRFYAAFEGCHVIETKEKVLDCTKCEYNNTHGPVCAICKENNGDLPSVNEVGL